MAVYQRYSQFNTRLIIVEGYTEKIIVNYLRDRFEKPLIYVKPEDAHGGTPHEIISFALNFIKHRDFQEKYIFIDTDKKIKEKDLELAQKGGFKFIYNTTNAEKPLFSNW